MDLDTQIIQKLLAAGVAGRDVRLFEEVTSTNSALRELAKAGAPEGTVVLADHQSAGRGQRGRHGGIHPPLVLPGDELVDRVLSASLRALT